MLSAPVAGRNHRAARQRIDHEIAASQLVDALGKKRERICLDDGGTADFILRVLGC